MEYGVWNKLFVVCVYGSVYAGFGGTCSTTSTVVVLHVVCIYLLNYAGYLFGWLAVETIIKMIHPNWDIMNISLSL